MTTPKLSMPELSVGQAGKELTHNQALAILDQLAQAVVVDKDLAAPPVSPANGSMYIVAAGATGAWIGQSGKLAYWLTTVAAWTFITPADGWSVWVTDEAVRYERKAGAWVVIATGGGGTAQGMNRLINGAFQVNQLALSGTVTLAAGAYGHDGWKGGAAGCTYTFSTAANVVTITISAGSLQQVIEGLNLQSGTHVLSWSGTAQGKIGGGSYGASGITGSAVGGTNLTVEFNVGTLSFVQLEPGSIASQFEHLHFSRSLMSCQRYFQKSFDYSALPQDGAFSPWLAGFSWISSGIGIGVIPLKVEMMSAPTVVFFRPSVIAAPSGSWAWYNGSAYMAGTPSLADAVSNTFGLSFNITVSGATLGSAYICRGNYTASARL